MEQILTAWGEWRRAGVLGSQALRSALGRQGCGGGLPGSRTPPGVEWPADAALVERLLGALESEAYRAVLVARYVRREEVSRHALKRAVGALVVVWRGDMEERKKRLTAVL